jgi:hypothetical protein
VFVCDCTEAVVLLVEHRHAHQRTDRPRPGVMACGEVPTADEQGHTLGALGPLRLDILAVRKQLCLDAERRALRLQIRVTAYIGCVHERPLHFLALSVVLEQLLGGENHTSQPVLFLNPQRIGVVHGQLKLALRPHSQHHLLLKNRIPIVHDGLSLAHACPVARHL